MTLIPHVLQMVAVWTTCVGVVSFSSSLSAAPYCFLMYDQSVPYGVVEASSCFSHCFLEDTTCISHCQ